jgi:hypothetical protein
MNTLGNKYAFAALKSKRAELAAQLKALGKQTKAVKAEMAHLDATLRLFDPSFDPRSIKPAKAARLHLFKQGELGRLILDALRRANGEPLPMPAIADSVADAIGQPEARAIIARRVRANLAYLERRQRAVVKIGERSGATWRLA